MCCYLITEKSSPFQLSLNFNLMYLKADRHQQPCCGKTTQESQLLARFGGPFKVTGLDESTS